MPEEGPRAEHTRVSTTVHRKYYSIERAREVLGYDPQDNSAHFEGEEKVVDGS